MPNMILRNVFFRYDALEYFIRFVLRITIFFLESFCVVDAGTHQRHLAMYRKHAEGTLRIINNFTHIEMASWDFQIPLKLKRPRQYFISVILASDFSPRTIRFGNEQSLSHFSCYYACYMSHKTAE
jgi:hypothetical protein